MTSPSSPVAPSPVIDRVAFYLFRKTVMHLPDDKAKQTWAWAAPAQRRQFVEEAEAIVRLVLGPPR